MAKGRRATAHTAIYTLRVNTRARTAAALVLAIWAVTPAHADRWYIEPPVLASIPPLVSVLASPLPVPQTPPAECPQVPGAIVECGR